MYVITNGHVVQSDVCNENAFLLISGLHCEKCNLCFRLTKYIKIVVFIESLNIWMTYDHKNKQNVSIIFYITPFYIKEQNNRLKINVAV